MKFNKKEIFTIPNILTYIRILCVPFFVWILLDSSIQNNIYIAFGIFIFASVTDLVDGFIARHYHLVSDIGKIADPIADKLLQVSTLVCLTVLEKIDPVFPLVFVIKESYMVIGGSAIVKLFKSSYEIKSNIFGKAATCLNSLGIVLAFFVGGGPETRLYDIAVNVILVCGAVFAVVTAIIYTFQFIQFRIKEVKQLKIKAVCDSTPNKENVIDANVVETPSEDTIVESDTTEKAKDSYDLPLNEDDYD